MRAHAARFRRRRTRSGTAFALDRSPRRRRSGRSLLRVALGGRIRSARRRRGRAGGRHRIGCRGPRAMRPSSRHPKAAEALPPAEAEAAPEAEVFARKTAGLFARALDGRPHRARVERRLSSRLIVAAGRPPHRYERARLSFQGTVLADTRGGPRWRGFRFHVAEAEREPTDELRARLREAAEPGDRPVDPPSGLSDVLLSRGCAIVSTRTLSILRPATGDGRASGTRRRRAAPTWSLPPAARARRRCFTG